MQTKPWLFKVSSMLVTIGAGIILIIGVFAGAIIMLGFVKDTPRWVGMGVFLSYLLLSAFLILVAEMASVLMKISDAVKKE